MYSLPAYENGNRMTFRLIRTGACVATLAAMIAGPALAQELGAEPTFADLTLEAGFMPDPQRIEITAGGDRNAGHSPAGECTGMIAGPPDIRLTYKPDELPLHIKAISDDDTTLVINDPNGQWFCDDDSGGDLNPLVSFTDPQEGVYDIWVGTIGEEPVPAIVEITELDD